MRDARPFYQGKTISVLSPFDFATVINWLNLGQLKPDWIAEKKMRALAQVGGVRHRDLPDARLISELAGNERDRDTLALISANSMSGKGIVAAPGVPADRAAILREALAGVMKDLDFALFLKSQKIEPEPRTPDYLADVIRRILATDPAIVKLVREKIDVQ